MCQLWIPQYTQFFKSYLLHSWTRTTCQSELQTRWLWYVEINIRRYLGSKFHISIPVYSLSHRRGWKIHFFTVHRILSLVYVVHFPLLLSKNIEFWKSTSYWNHNCKPVHGIIGVILLLLSNATSVLHVSWLSWF